ncbi:MAG: Gldg family protein [Candidatus Cloacimonetes bacterium]|nr:Gldg family protein [Candidatus Cloacimonadota bacterium]
MNKKSNWINFIILVVIIVFVTLLSQTFFSRLDFSRGKIYSISKASKQSVKNLDDRMVVKAYFSKSLPGEYADARRFTQDLLDEYQAYSGGKLRYEFVDPKEEDDLKEEAQKYQIQPMTMRVNEQDQLVLREIYMGLAFLYQDKVEAIPFIQNTQGLEYDITKAVKKISAQKMKQIAFYSSDDEEMSMGRGEQVSTYQTVRQIISESYELSDNDLTQPLTSDIDALIVTGVADTLSEDQLYNLDQYIMQGGNVIIIQDRVKADIQSASANVFESNFFDLLASYGIVAKKNLISDAECGQISVRRTQGIFSSNTPVEYPYLPIISNRNKDNPIVKNIDVMQMVFASEIDTSKVINDFTPLFYSSAHSGQTSGPRFDISYNNFMQKDLRAMLTEGKKVLGGMYSGNFTSYFADNDNYPDLIPSTGNARIIFVPSGSFIREDAGGRAPGNQDFVLNSVDYLAGDEGLIEIRSRETEYRPLKPVSNSTRQLIKWLNILLPSLLLILYGIIRWRKEVNRKIRIGDLYE